MKWGETEYYIRELQPHVFSVAKFTTSFAPDHVYIIRWETCSCPVGFDCKHVRLLKHWVAEGTPPMRTYHVNARGAWEGQIIKGMGAINI